MREFPFVIAALSVVAVFCQLPLGGAARSDAAEPPHARQFIAHRGVNLHSTMAGENSLEAIGYTRRAGFATIETDVRLTADRQLVIMHDETLNRTCLAADGTALRAAIPVAEVTLAELRENYVLKADSPAARTRVPTLREYLEECRSQGLLPFIEPKLNDPSGAHYRDIIRVADEVLGRGGYIITSNNRANRVIRGLGISDVRLMGILYQTTFEDIAGWGNAIMAISATRFTPSEFAVHAGRARAAGIPIESHADTFAHFSVINDHAVDFVSTDELAPDLAPGARPLAVRAGFDAFRTTGREHSGVLRLALRDRITLMSPLPEIPFGGIYLEMEVEGQCVVRLAQQKFNVEAAGRTTIRHQLLVYDAAPGFEVEARGACEVSRITVKLVGF